MQVTGTYFEDLTAAQRMLFFLSAANFLASDLRYISLDEDRSDSAARSALLPRTGFLQRLTATNHLSVPDDCAAVVNGLLDDADVAGVRALLEGAFDQAVRTVSQSDAVL